MFSLFFVFFFSKEETSPTVIKSFRVPQKYCEIETRPVIFLIVSPLKYVVMVDIRSPSPFLLYIPFFPSFSPVDYINSRGNIVVFISLQYTAPSTQYLSLSSPVNLDILSQEHEHTLLLYYLSKQKKREEEREWRQRFVHIWIKVSLYRFLSNFTR